MASWSASSIKPPERARIQSMRSSSIAAACGGAYRLRWWGREWRKDRELTGYEFRSVCEDFDGRVWATTKEEIFRIDFNADPPRTERFGAASGVPPDYKYVYRVGDRLL